MSTFTAVLDPSRTDREGHSKFLSRLFGPGTPLQFAPDSFKVVQRGSGANFSVDVSVGDGHFVLPSRAFSYCCWTDAATNVPIPTAADPTNGRVDVVYAWIDTSVTTTGSNNSPGSLKFGVSVGTPAGTNPSANSDSAIQTALGAGVAWLRLAYVFVGANSPSIIDANITDARVALVPIAVATPTLGYAQIISNFSTSNQAATQVPGLSVPVTVPNGGRRVKVTTSMLGVSANVAGTVCIVTLWDGPVGTGTQIAQQNFTPPVANYSGPINAIAVIQPSAGAKTYNVGFHVTGNTGSLAAAANFPAFVLVELA